MLAHLRIDTLLHLERLRMMSIRLRWQAYQHAVAGSGLGLPEKSIGCSGMVIQTRPPLDAMNALE